MTRYDFTLDAYGFQLPLSGAPNRRQVAFEVGSIEDYPVSVDVSCEGGELVISDCYLRHCDGLVCLDTGGAQGVLHGMIASEALASHSDAIFCALGVRPFDPRREYGTLDARSL